MTAAESESPCGRTYAVGDLELLEAAFASLHEGVTVHDASGQIVACNRAAARLFGLSVDEVIGSSDSLRSRLDVRYKDDTPVTADNSQVSRVLATGEPVRGSILRYRPPGRRAPRWVRGNFHPLLRGGREKPWGVVCSFVDVTHAEGAEARLRDFSRQLRAVLADERALCYVKDLEGRYLYANRRVGQLFGLARSEIIGKTQAEVLPADLDRECDRSNVAALEQRGVVEAEETFELAGEPRTYLTVKFPLLDDSDKPWAVAGVSIDITDRKRAEEAREWRLVRAAFYDPLTACANRALVAEHLALALARAQRNGSTVVLVFLDVDNLKAVNDGLGHAAGDELLRVLAGRLERTLRSSDVVGLLDADVMFGRHGGDEFVLLLNDLGADPDVVVRAVSDRLEVALGEPFEFSGRSIAPSVSYGTSVYPRDGVTAEALLDHADSAMYEMKRGRRPSAAGSPAHRVQDETPTHDGDRGAASRLGADAAEARARDSLGRGMARLAAVADRTSLPIVIVPEQDRWSVMLAVPGEQAPRLRALGETLDEAVDAILAKAAGLGL